MEDRQKIEQAIRALEAQREVLGEEVTNASIASLREKLSVLSARSARRRKQVTLLLADLSGFTALSEQMDAEDVQQLMNTLWAELDRVIVGYGGYIDKHIGDAVLAFWGMEAAREDDPANATRAANCNADGVAAGYVALFALAVFGLLDALARRRAVRVLPNNWLKDQPREKTFDALAAGLGSEVEIETTGPDEQQAIDAIVALINDKFGEGE